jgi:3-(3-hydroxy-phenyl)propionate hydroxylase
MPKQPPFIYDVAIVGCGPVGATFANLIAEHGVRIAVIDKAADVFDKPRAITVDHEVLRAFQACGIADLIESNIAPHPGTHFLGVDDDVIKIFDPKPPPHPLGWVPTATFVQPDIERGLRAKLAERANVDTFLATAATTVAQDADDVRVAIVRPDGTAETLRARYLVACDGAASPIRKALGIALDDLAFDEWWIVVDAHTRDPDLRPNKCFQYCRPSRPGTYLPGPGALRRWEIKLLPGERPENFAGEEDILAVLRQFTDPSDLRIWRTAVYRFHALLAQRWRVGRILLMGDAMHQMPPFLGQGLAAGVRDAFNLAWKLALVLSGKAGEGVLDTYEVERRPHVRAVVATAKEFGRIIGELDPAVARARDARLKAELRAGTARTVRQEFIPDLATGLIAPHAPLAGTLFVQPQVRLADGAIVRLDNVFGHGFAIVAASAAPLCALSPDRLRAWRDLGGTRVVVGDEPSAAMPDDIVCVAETGRLFVDWLRTHAVAAVVVRPDRYVYGAVVHPRDLDGLVGDVIARVTRPGHGPPVPGENQAS